MFSVPAYRDKVHHELKCNINFLRTPRSTLNLTFRILPRSDSDELHVQVLIGNNTMHNSLDHSSQGNTMANNKEGYQSTGNGNGNGNGGGYQGGFQGGNTMSRTITPGGHAINEDLLAIGMAPRKIANPLPLGVMSFATTTLTLSLYNVGVRGITVPNAIVTYALMYGGLTQYLS